VAYALKTGYRHIDTADAYHNHAGVGQGIINSGVKREEIFLATKVWRDNLAPNTVRADTERFLHELKTGYIDLLLVHWPNSKFPIQDTMAEFSRLKREGLVRAIGVSNFTSWHIDEALKTGADIEVNQVEFHPSLNQKGLKQYCDEQGIVLAGYSPLAQGQDFGLSIIRELAEKYSRTPAQIILNWLMAKGLVAIHGSRREEHIDDNRASHDFALDPADIKRINDLPDDLNRQVLPRFNEFDKENRK